MKVRHFSKIKELRVYVPVLNFIGRILKDVLEREENAKLECGTREALVSRKVVSSRKMKYFGINLKNI